LFTVELQTTDLGSQATVLSFQRSGSLRMTDWVRLKNERGLAIPVSGTKWVFPILIFDRLLSVQPGYDASHKKS
jgi:hypothetical protein